MLNLLVFLISMYSVGGFIDPVSHGVSLRLKNVVGLHIIGAFGNGERELYIYDNGQYEYKPFYWYNIGLRGEYFLSQEFVQSYVAVGIAIKDEQDWAVRWVYEEDTAYYKSEQLKEKYKSVVIAFGLEIRPLKETAEGITFLENLSLAMEFPVIYHKFEYQVDGTWDYYGDRKKTRSGMGLSLGIHYNFK